MKIPLIGGTYLPRSPIAGTAQSFNLYPEANGQDAPTPFTLYQRPGLTMLVQGPNAPVRGLWRSSDGQGWAVIGQTLYYVSPVWILTAIGAITPGVTTPVTFIDNGAYLLVTDDSNNVWQVKLSDHSGFGLVAGLSASDLDYVDGFILYASPASNNWGSSLFNSITFDPTYTAVKTDWPDHISAMMVNQRQILLLGQLKSALWYNAGGPTFPFAELPGAYFEHGLAARYAHAWNDISAFWLSQNLQGVNYVMRQRGYNATRVSNFSLETAMSKMPTIADAIALTFGFVGHAFLMLQFPSARQTWVFDDSIEDPRLAWHQETYYDAVAGLGRHRANCVATMYGKVVFGDYANGKLYALDLTNFADAGQPIVCSQVLQHVKSMPDQRGQEVLLAGKRIRFDSLTIDGETGTYGTDATNPPMFSLSWSDDRGRTFGNPVNQSAGALGQYLTFPKWAGPLGIARDRIFRLDYSIPGPAAIQGVWVEGEVLDS